MGAYIKGDGSLSDARAVGSTITTAATEDTVTITNTTGKYALVCSTDGGNNACRLGDNSGSRYTLYAYRNLTSANTASPAVYLRNDNAGDDQPTVEIDQDAPAVAILIVSTSTAADIHITPRAAAGMGAGTEGDIYYDATGHKLMVRDNVGYKSVNVT